MFHSLLDLRIWLIAGGLSWDPIVSDEPELAGVDPDQGGEARSVVVAANLYTATHSYRTTLEKPGTRQYGREQRQL